MSVPRINPRPILARTRRLFWTPALAALVALAPGAAAQEWDVNLGGATLNASSSAYADISCNNPGGVFVMPGPLDAGLCPCDPTAGGPPGSDFDYENAQSIVGPFYWTDPSGILTLHFGGGAAEPSLDLSGPPVCGFGDYASSAPIAIVQGNGLGTRSLTIKWWAEVNNESNFDGPFAARGCAEILSSLTANVVDLPAEEYIVRYDWRAFGDADGLPECPADLNCFNWGIPPGEDVEFANLDLGVSFNGGAAPGNLFSGLSIDNDITTPEAGVFLVPWDSDAVFLNAGDAFTVDLDLQAQAHSQMVGPVDGADSARFVGLFVLHLVVHEFVLDEPFDSYMRPVPSAGCHPLRVGRHEITNQQYADFLNSAENDLGLTELSSNMMFQPDGSVALLDGTVLFEPQSVNAASRIVYDDFAPIGTRYTVEVELGSDARSYEKHAVVGVSWFGALKFCNWLTLKRGLGASQRCYSEGPSAADWHPVTITTAAWSTRDLDDWERGLLVAAYRGFRLPMDNLGTSTGWISNQQNCFNEWYRSAAYDPAAPGVTRIGPGGESVPGFHWIYGIGRDALGSSDANFVASADPFDDDDAFVGMYSGAAYNSAGAPLVGDGSFFATSANDNPWGIHDLSGNVAELMQDRPSSASRAVRGGSWLDPSSKAAASYRDVLAADATAGNVGFRIVQTELVKTRRAPTPRPAPGITIP